jgi:hypothetical protein
VSLITAAIIRASNRRYELAHTRGLRLKPFASQSLGVDRILPRWSRHGGLRCSPPGV